MSKKQIRIDKLDCENIVFGVHAQVSIHMVCYLTLFSASGTAFKKWEIPHRFCTKWICELSDGKREFGKDVIDAEAKYDGDAESMQEAEQELDRSLFIFFSSMDL